MTLTLLPHRAVLRVEGEDRKTFLQGIITNDITKLTPQNPLYTALLSPQGKFLFDLFLVEDGESILIDCWSEKAEALMGRLMMYKLRAKVKVTREVELKVYTDPESRISNPEFFSDPRHPEMGQRLIAPVIPNEQREEGSEQLQGDSSAAQAAFGMTERETYHLHRLSLGIPDSADFIDERSFPIEFGLANLHAISFTKGCYVGQEVVARSKTRGTINKALHQVESLDNSPLPAPGTPIFAGEAEIGQMRSSEGSIGLAVIRLEHSLNPSKCEARELAKGSEAMGVKTPLKIKLPHWFSLPTPVMQVT